MNKFKIKGLGGEKKLAGSVFVNGAKNSALKAMAGSILFEDEVILNNIPNTEDIHTMKDILIDLGAKVEWLDGDPKSKTIKIDSSTISKTDIKADLARNMRASVVLTGPMLARFGRVSFPAPGGCVIGARPIDLFLEGYKDMGAGVELKDGLYHIQAQDGLKGTGIKFKKVSVGGTETLMMAATLAKGQTVLENCAMEPEIGNVAEWLVSCGADIKGIGTGTLTVEGTAKKLFKHKNPYTAIPDRIEAGSFLILGALCAKELKIEDCRPDHLVKLIDLLRDSGVDIRIEKKTDGNETIIVSNDKRDGDFRFKAFNVQTKEYPGFPTDLQPLITVFLTQSEGESTVEETIFEGRFKYVDDLKKMGADITCVDRNQVLIKGPTSLLLGDEELSAHDIRAGFAMVMASLIGKGKCEINNVHLIDRGYENLESRLGAIGADITRRSSVQA